MPDAVPAENVSLDADTERSAAAMEEAGMESEPAQLVENGPIAEARDADEIWLTSSSKDVAAVIELDGEPVGAGKAGPVWEKAEHLFSERKFDY